MDGAADVPELPIDAVLTILDCLPSHLKAWYRVLSKACAAHLGNNKRISASAVDLPLWLLQQHCADLTITARKEAEGMQHDSITKQQAQLLAARAGAGDLVGVKWLRSQGCAWSSHSCIAAAEAGHLDVLRWLLSQRPACPLDAGVCALAAAAAGQVHVLRFLHSELLLRPFDLAACAEAAGAAGHQAVLDWLVLQDARVAAAAAAATIDHVTAAAARLQVRQIMTLARGRTPPHSSMRAHPQPLPVSVGA